MVLLMMVLSQILWYYRRFCGTTNIIRITNTNIIRITECVLIYSMYRTITLGNKFLDHIIFWPKILWYHCIL